MCNFAIVQWNEELRREFLILLLLVGSVDFHRYRIESIYNPAIPLGMRFMRENDR